MKKFFTLIILLSFFTIVKAQYVDLPDGDFKTLLMQKYPACFNGSGQLDTTCNSIRLEDSLEFHFNDDFSGTSLEGLQYFTSLKYLNCSRNVITFCPPLPASLLYLDYSFNDIDGPGTSVYPTGMPNALRYLNIDSGYFPLSNATFPDSLRYLSCSGNSISSILYFPSKLETLICSRQFDLTTFGQILKTLPALPATLKYLDCSLMSLDSLPALPALLTYLNCSGQSDGSAESEVVAILTTLPVLPNSLIYLNCSNNKLTTLPKLPAGLIDLDCSFNMHFSQNQPFPIINPGISTLNTLPPNLANLFCQANNISCLPHLPSSMGGQSPYRPGGSINFVFDNNAILCIPNSVSGLRPGYLNAMGQLIAFTPAFCTPVTNANQCVFNPVIAGNIYYDNNSNGVKDAGEEYRANVKVQLSNGVTGFSDNNGRYELSADLGNYTVTVDAPQYYKAVPATAIHTFNSYDTVTTDLISLQPTASVDSVSVSILPYNYARPGSSFNYTINYENVGTTTISAVIHVNYDGTRLIYDNSSDPSVITNGSILSLTIPPLTPGQKGSFISNFTINTSVIRGDTLFGKATISAGAKTSIDSTYTVIKAAYDPNEKQATPSLTPQQVTSGSYINYLISFQNTGTDTAFSVVVTDTLSTKLQAGTLQMIGSSAPCRITQHANIITFEFLNILLPDSNTNSAGSHGYIKFRIKAQASLSDSVINNADIYFDYNTPVTTANAKTSVTLITLPLELISFKALSQKNGTALLYWSTANEQGTRSFVVEQSTDGSTFKPLASLAAHGSGSNIYMQNVYVTSSVIFYRLKIIDADGLFKYSSVVKMVADTKSDDFIIVSNPVKNLLNLRVNNHSLNNTKADVISSGGTIVKTCTLIEGMQTIMLNNLSAGNYFLRTISGGKKFVIIK